MKNFTNILSKQAKTTPDSIAIVTTNLKINYKLLENYVWEMSTYLYNKGVREGNVVVVINKDELLYAIVILAIGRIGATVYTLPLNITKEFFKKNIQRINASFIVSDTLKKVEINIDFIKINFNILKDISIDYSVYCSHPKASWEIITGSGSTGIKKLINTSHELQNNITRFYSLSEPEVQSFDRISSTIPLFYATGQRRLFQSIYAGATYVILQKHNFNESIKILKYYKISILFSNAFYIEKVLQSLPLNSNHLLDSIKISLGTASVSLELRKRIKNLLTDNLIIRYGTNECNPICIASNDDVCLEEGIVGKPLQGIELEIVDNNDNKKKANEIGFIRVKSPCMIKSYLDDEVASKRAFRNGWFYPGDIGKLNQNGQLIHMGRADDMMIVNGINIYPLEIEQAIISHPDVNDVKALPIKSEIHQDIPTCIISLNKNSKENEESLLRYITKKLGNNNVKKILIIDTIPRTKVGKIKKIELYEKINALLSQSQ